MSKNTFSLNVALGTTPVEELELSRRSLNSIRRAGITTVLELERLIETDTLNDIRNIGQLSIDEIIFKTKKIKAQIANKPLPEQLDLFAHNIQITRDNLSDQVLLDYLPVEIIAAKFGKALFNQIKAAGFRTFGELKLLTKIVGEFEIENLAPVLQEITLRQRAQLLNQLSEGQLHPDVMFMDKTLSVWAEYVPKQIENQLQYFKILSAISRNSTIGDDLSELFIDQEDRNFAAFIAIFGSGKTLDAAGKELCLTRERVRQVTTRSARRVWALGEQNPCLFIRSALYWAQHFGNELSLSKWKNDLQKRKILGKLRLPMLDDDRDADSFDLLQAFLRSTEKVKTPLPFTIADNLRLLLKHSSDLSIGAIKAFDNIDPQQKREVLRVIRYTGGVHISNAANILKLDPSIAQMVLNSFGLVEIEEEWFTFADVENVARLSVRTAGLKMMEVCGPLSINSFCDGIRRYASRFFDSIAPVSVLKYIIGISGFELENDLVCWVESPENNLADTDKAFVSVINQFGSVVTFQEVAQYFLDSEFSIPAASATLRHSPIVEKIDFGLYKIRDYPITWKDIEDAKNRQLNIEKNPQVIYGVDGIIRYQITLGSWALSGVITIGQSGQLLPDLGDGWKLICGDVEHGIVNRDENLLWGFGRAFKALNIKPGERIELAFNAWNEPKVIVAKIDNVED